MRRRVFTILGWLMLLMGLSLLLYPTASNYVKLVRQRRAIAAYMDSVSVISEDDYSELFEAAQAFNEKLARSGYALGELPADVLAEYESLLDVSGTGILGYINIPKGDIMLPVYHGTSEATLQVGAGHVEGSSFPIAGESVHAVISGHRGLPGSMLFTNIDKLEKDDTFSVYVLDEMYMYRVTGVETVLPSQLNQLFVASGQNQCTLVTCTPYGINSHRLLIHARLLSEEETERELLAQPSAGEVPVWVLIAVFEVPAILITVIIAARRARKER